MPYKIYVAETEAKARESQQAQEEELSIDYKVHQRMFEPEFEMHDLTMFYQLSDFYLNATFTGGDVIVLRGEVEEARKRIHDPKCTELLSLFSKVCARAMKAQRNIYGFGE